MLKRPHSKNKRLPPIECYDSAVQIVIRSVISVMSVVSVSSVEETPTKKKVPPQLSVMSDESVNSVKETPPEKNRLPPIDSI